MHLQSGISLQGGKYRIEKTLGQGGFGITYLGVQTGLNRSVAIKEFFMKDYCEREETTSEVLFGFKNNRDIVDRFRIKFIKEAQIIAQMDSPHIIRIHDIFEENATAYYVMEYINGDSLETLIQKEGKLDKSTILVYIKQIAKALDYIHQKKILHLDIKPSNILLRHKKEVVLIDFGISKRYDNAGTQTSTTPAGISKGYAPIEQYRHGGTNMFMPSTDIYSLGATMYKLATGETPPEASDIVDEGLTIPISIDKDIAFAIEACMAPARKQRPQSIAEFTSLITAESQEHEKSHTHNTSNEDIITQPSTDRKYLKIDVNGVLFKMCFIEGGTIIMGATPEQEHEAYGDEKGNKRVKIQSFYLGETTVTQELWNSVMENNPANNKGDNLPVEKISWIDCMNFIQKLNKITGYDFRLPTEEEWEYAARGGNQSKGYKYAGENQIDEIAWYDGNSGYQTHPVASKKPNELGLYDMSGNVQEWCFSFYEYSSNRVLRGGCYLSSPRRCRVSCRNSNCQVYNDASIGLRLAL